MGFHKVALSTFQMTAPVSGSIAMVQRWANPKALDRPSGLGVAVGATLRVVRASLSWAEACRQTRCCQRSCRCSNRPRSIVRSLGQRRSALRRCCVRRERRTLRRRWSRLSRRPQPAAHTEPEPQQSRCSCGRTLVPYPAPRDAPTGSSWQADPRRERYLLRPEPELAVDRIDGEFAEFFEVV